MNGSLKFVGLAVVLAGGMVVSSAVVSKFFLRVRQEKCIVVKGTAEVTVASDVGAFECLVSLRGASQTEVFALVQRQSKIVLERLADSGVTKGCLGSEEFSSAAMFKRGAEGQALNEVEGYNVSWRVEVSSKDVELIKRAAQDVMGLLKYGVGVSISGPRYFVSNLEAVKRELLQRATADGFERATILAANGKGRVGELVAARQGVFQITRLNSSDSDDYGVYDTSSIEKSVKAVVTLEYALGK